MVCITFLADGHCNLQQCYVKIPQWLFKKETGVTRRKNPWLDMKFIQLPSYQTDLQQLTSLSLRQFELQIAYQTRFEAR